MTEDSKPLHFYTDNWFRRIQGATTKAELLLAYYEISKEVNGLQAAKLFSDKDLHDAVTDLFYPKKRKQTGHANVGIRDQTRGRRLMNLCKMNKSLIERSAKDLRADLNGVSISHMLLLTLVKHKPTMQENRAVQRELYDWSIENEAGFRALKEKLRTTVPPLKAVRPTIVINELTRAATELEKRLKQLMEPEVVKAIDNVTPDLRSRTVKQLADVSKTLERITRKIDKSKQCIEAAKLKLKLK